MKPDPAGVASIQAALQGGHPRGLYLELATMPGHARIDFPGREGWSILLVARHAEALAVLKNPQLFSSASGSFNHPCYFRKWGGRLKRLFHANLNSSDPPDHTRFRRVIAPILAAPVVAARREEFATRLKEVWLRRRRTSGPQEYADFGLELSSWSSQLLFGIPPGWSERFRHWGVLLMAGNASPALSRAGETLRMFGDLLACAQEALATAGPETVMGAAREAMRRGDISGEEAEGFLLLLAIAGVETTAQTLTQTLLAMALFPHELDKLKERPDQVPAAVDEILRWTAVARQFYRTPTADTMIGGTPVRAGEAVGILFGAANQDPAVFADGTRFDVDRPNTRLHLTFGAGPHFCLGSWLARMQIECLLRLLVADVRGIDLCADPQWAPSLHLAGLSSLMLEVR